MAFYMALSAPWEIPSCANMLQKQDLPPIIRVKWRLNLGLDGAAVEFEPQVVSKSQVLVVRTWANRSLPAPPFP